VIIDKPWKKRRERRLYSAPSGGKLRRLRYRASYVFEKTAGGSVNVKRKNGRNAR